MPVSRYLPSAQFVFIVASVALSGGLVLAAQYITDDSRGPSLITTNDASLAQNTDWKAALYEIQGTSPLDIQGSGSVQAGLGALLADADTQNVTNSIGRSLFINLSEAKSQGLGGDIPTQEKLLAQATENLKPTLGQVYTVANLTITSDSPTTLHAYGNAVMEIVGGHPKANMPDTYMAVGKAVDTGNEKELAVLTAIGSEYEAISEELLLVPVPQTLSPLHLRIVNNFSQMAATFADMQTVLADPLRGFAGLQTYNSLADETRRLLTNIAQSFSKNVILFDIDEPGKAWDAFLPQ